MTKTTKEIIDEYTNKYRRISADSNEDYENQCIKIHQENDNIKWFSQSDLVQLRQELKDKSDVIMNNFDLNMSERKGAYIMACELLKVLAKYIKED